jgi:hypothetical protein
MRLRFYGHPSTESNTAIRRRRGELPQSGRRAAIAGATLPRPRHFAMMRPPQCARAVLASSPMTMTITIPSRFCGPPSAGNGGYTAGLLAAELDGPVEVLLRRPLPLDRELRLEPGPPVTLRDGDEVLASARRTSLAVDVPPLPSFAAAEQAARGYAGFARHQFPGGFVCGPSRHPGDGLRIFAGRVPGTDVVAAPWVPDATLADDDGRIPAEILWAAIDCPGYFAIAEDDETAVLAHISGEMEPGIRVGERCVVGAWPIGREGRRLEAATALVDESGTVRGRSLQTWILLR